MKLLIVVSKLLTGFDAPSATYLYLDKKMEGHDLFQAICRVNRTNNEYEEKEFGYIVDYKQLFKNIEDAVNDYTTGAFSDYDKEDVEGLLTDRFENAKRDLDTALERVEHLCEPVAHPKTTNEFLITLYSTNAARSLMKKKLQLSKVPPYAKPSIML